MGIINPQQFGLLELSRGKGDKILNFTDPSASGALVCISSAEAQRLNRAYWAEQILNHVDKGKEPLRQKVSSTVPEVLQIERQKIKESSSLLSAQDPTFVECEKALKMGDYQRFWGLVMHAGPFSRTPRLTPMGAARLLEIAYEEGATLDREVCTSLLSNSRLNPFALTLKFAQGNLNDGLVHMLVRLIHERAGESSLFDPTGVEISQLLLLLEKGFASDVTYQPLLRDIRLLLEKLRDKPEEINRLIYPLLMKTFFVSEREGRLSLLEARRYASRLLFLAENNRMDMWKDNFEKVFPIRLSVIKEVLGGIKGKYEGKLVSLDDLGVYEQDMALDFAERPAELKERISKAFVGAHDHTTKPLSMFSEETRPSWMYCGAPTYQLCGVDEQSLMKKIILAEYPKRKDFFVLDIGGGDFSWSRSLAKFLDEQTDLPSDIKIHIIGTRAEEGETPSIEQTARCEIHNLDAFKTEEILEEFKRRGLDLQNKVDMVVSRMTFCHLVDPVGTFVQTYNLVRPQTGFLLIDGFSFALEGQERFENRYEPTAIENRNIAQLFLDTKAPFLTRFCGHHLNRFILRKPNESPCKLPMRYTGRIRNASNKENFSGAVTEFQRQEQPKDQIFILPNSLENIHGDKGLYEWLKQNHLFNQLYLKWTPFQWTDENSKIPPLHQAILDGDKKIIAQMLVAPHINESDSYGATPLHYAVGHQKIDAFLALMNKGADVALCDGEGQTPLHFAAQYDKEGSFLSRLIQAGADVNRQVEGYKVPKETPLDQAIECVNLKAAEILIRAGAHICEKTPAQLEAFTESLVREGKLSSSDIATAKIRLVKESRSYDPLVF